MTLPRFYRWSSSWSYGWLTGRHNDLVCITPRISEELKEPRLSVILSPISSTRFLAFCAFLMKTILVRIDDNLKRKLLGDETGN